MAGIPESYQKLSYKSQIWKDNKNLAHYKISEEEITINVEITISPDKILPQKFPQLPGEYLKLPKEKKKVTFMQKGWRYSRRTEYNNAEFFKTYFESNITIGIF